MIQAAKEGLLKTSSAKHRPYLMAVTVLTSFSEKQLQDQLKITEPLQNYATYLADNARKNGADGVVCSVHEVKHIKNKCGAHFLTITPGIRLKDSGKNDQQRIATPSIAKAKRTDMIVVGRTVTQAKNPRLAYEQVLKEWLSHATNGGSRFN